MYARVLDALFDTFRGLHPWPSCVEDAAGLWRRIRSSFDISEKISDSLQAVVASAKPLGFAWVSGGKLAVEADARCVSPAIRCGETCTDEKQHDIDRISSRTL